MMNRPPSTDFTAVDGVLLVDKPSGPTSHDVVDRIRRHFRLDKVGHGGSLDPLATGLLVILIGRATRLSDRFMGCDKTYEGRMRFGIATDSHDAQGAATKEVDSSFVTKARLEEEMLKFKGDQLQTPPMVSAVKKDGVPLYKLARRGETVERKPKLIHVYEFTLLDFAPPVASFRLRCTKGTYVRTIVHDIGQGLGCGAHLEQLRRTECGGLRIEEAVTTPVLLEMSLRELGSKLTPLNRVPGSR